MQSTDFSVYVDHQGKGAVSINTNGAEADQWGIHGEQAAGAVGNLSIVSRGTVRGSSGPRVLSGVVGRHAGDGDVDIQIFGDIFASDVAIDAEHEGDSGDISITADTGTTLTASGGSGPSLAPGPVGILADRSSTSSATGNITIWNGARIQAEYAGIYVSACGCIVGDINITSVGSIEVDPTGSTGIDVYQGGKGDVRIETSGNIDAPTGIAVLHDGDGGDVFVTTASDTTINAGQGGYGDAGIAVDRISSDASSITIDNGADIYGDYGIVVGQNLGLGSRLTVAVRSSGALAAATGIAVYQVSDGAVSVTSTGAISADDIGIQILHLGSTGNVDVSSSGEIQSSHIGVDITSLSNGQVSVKTAGDITSTENAINIMASGAVSVSTLSGTTIEATGGGPTVNSLALPSSTAPTTIPLGAYGISALTVGDHNVVVTNGADIVADGIGISAEVCSCGDGSVSVVSTGNVSGTIGILARADAGDAYVDLQGGTVTGTIFGAGTIGKNTFITVGRMASVSTLGAYVDGGIAHITVAGKITGRFGEAVGIDNGPLELTLHSGYDIAGVVRTFIPSTNDTLILGGSTSAAFDLGTIGSRYLGFDAFKKTGTSIWTLSDTGSFADTITADAGKLVINTAITGLDITLIGTGAVGGSGTFNSLTTNGGFLAPGNSPGTLTLLGAANFTNVIYNAEVNAAGVSDKLLVGTTTTLNGTGNTVVAMPEAGAYNKTTTYTILTSGSPISGAFGGVSSASPLFAASLSADATNVYLTLTRNAAGAGLTPNQKATGTGLDSFAGPAPYFDKLMQLPSAQIPAALSALSGDGYASLITALITDQRYLRDATLDRLAATRFTPGPIIANGFAAVPDMPVASEIKIWGRGYGGLSTLPGDGNAPAVNHGAGGLVAGADAEFGTMRLGALTAAGISSFAIPDRAMSGTSGDFSMGAYGDTNWDDFYLSFGTTLTGRSISTTRTAAFAGVSDVFTAQYAALTSQAFGELGKRIDFGATTLTPFAGLALINTLTSGFTETGTGAGALTVASSSTSAALLTLGVRIEHQFILSDDMLVTLSGSAAWRHGMGGMGATSNNFQGGAPFTVLGAPLPADQLLLTAGADFNVSEDLSAGFAYSGAIGNGGAHALTATLTGHF
ncbi:MAG: autotransporter domain-containing protein, partial [Devosia sp.]